MNKLKEDVIGLLNMGLNPTVVGFQDDGLFYLFDSLLKGKLSSNGYDPTFTFTHVTLDSGSKITSENLELEINRGLESDPFPGNTIYETIANQIEVVCVMDNIADLQSIETIIEVCDNLIKKYREKLRFVYIVEDPSLLSKLKNKIFAQSSFFDAVVYQKIGVNWDEESLYEFLKPQFKKELTADQLNLLKEISGNHFGTYKRLYKDWVLNLETTQRYVELLIENFDPATLNTFRKVIRNEQLNSDEEKIASDYSKVNLLKGNKITIPILESAIKNSKVPNKIFIDTTDKLSGLDLNLLSKTERDITEALMKTNEIISKEEMGNVIWKDRAGEMFSVWAVDQRISRLRRKFMDLGLEYDIQTVYGKGFKLVKFGNN